MRDYYIKNREKCQAYGRNYYYQHKEQVKEYRIKNREKILAYLKKYSFENRERKKEYRLKNRERDRQWHQEYYQRNKERLKEKRFQKELGVGAEAHFVKGEIPVAAAASTPLDQLAAATLNNKEMG
jgi:hypothetical protein